MRIGSCKQVGVAFLVFGLAACSSETDSADGTSEARATPDVNNGESAGSSKDSDDAEGAPIAEEGEAVGDDPGGDDSAAGSDDSFADEPIVDGDGVSGPTTPGAASMAPAATGTTTSAAPIGMPTSSPAPIATDPAGAPATAPPPSDEGIAASDDGDSADEPETEPEDPSADDATAAEPDDGGAEPDVTPEPEPEPPPPPPANQAGLLTAGVWDDNRNFDRFESFRDEIYQSGVAGLLDFENTDYAEANELFSQTAGPRETLDIALVIDTTGSMGDEMEYLQTEIRSISMRIEKVYPDAEQRWALIVYRDVGDEYVTQNFDFDTDPETFRSNLAAQSVGGGGDFPEAPEAAFEAMNQLSWRTDDATARLAFWVADAPYHDRDAADMTAAIAGAQSLGVHIYPVASSGIDEFTELGMRSAAQLTGGRYIFLTDDSGVGGAHLEPSIPCYFVTRLDVAMLRMVNIEMSGEYQVPADDEIIRTGGDPQDGACELSSGDAVFVF
jgi:hypothetical protein